MLGHRVLNWGHTNHAMDVQALCFKLLHITFLKLRFCKIWSVFFFSWNSRSELLRSWFLSVFLNFRFTCALVCKCTRFVGYFVCIMNAKCFSYLLLPGVLFFRIFLVCRSYGHLSTRSHDYFVVKCTCAIVRLDGWPHRKPSCCTPPFLHCSPLFQAMVIILACPQ